LNQLFLARLLRPRGERPLRRAAEQRYELASFEPIELHSVSCQRRIRADIVAKVF